MKRRWFELANDLVWFSAGLLNCFYFVGALAPFAFYVSLAAFAIDIILSLTRTYIELSRLYELHAQYAAMLNEVNSAKEEKQIYEQLKAIDKQIAFEQYRLISHLITTVAIFLCICCALPIFAANPIIPVIGAICLAMICVINFALTEEIAKSRPVDTIERSPALAKLGFFSKKEATPVRLDLLSEEEEDMECDESLCCLQ
jgi:hypothetical protein